MTSTNYKLICFFPFSYISLKNITTETKSLQLSSLPHYGINYVPTHEQSSFAYTCSVFYGSKPCQKAKSQPYHKRKYDKFISNPLQKHSNEADYKQIELESYAYFHFFPHKSSA